MLIAPECLGSIRSEAWGPPPPQDCGKQPSLPDITDWALRPGLGCAHVNFNPLICRGPKLDWRSLWRLPVPKGLWLAALFVGLFVWSGSRVSQAGLELTV